MNTNPAPSAPGPESTVWQGSPSQIIHLPQYLLWSAIFIILLVSGTRVLGSMEPVPTATKILFAIVAAIPVFAIGWKWLVLKNTRYELTTQRLRTRTGVFNKHLDELELYRVRDYKLAQPFFLRLFSLSTIVLQTSDKSTQVVVLRAIKGGESVREQMRTYVEEARMRRGVREVDME